MVFIFDSLIKGIASLFSVFIIFGWLTVDGIVENTDYYLPYCSEVNEVLKEEEFESATYEKGKLILDDENTISAPKRKGYIRYLNISKDEKGNIYFFEGFDLSHEQGYVFVNDPECDLDFIKEDGFRYRYLEKIEENCYRLSTRE